MRVKVKVRTNSGKMWVGASDDPCLGLQSAIIFSSSHAIIYKKVIEWSPNVNILQLAGSPSLLQTKYLTCIGRVKRGFLIGVGCTIVYL